jgi:hypothetical protein
MSKLTHITMACVFSVALIASGCGGGGSGAPALTRAEFIKQGDSVCRKFELKKKNAIEDFLQKEGQGRLKTLNAAKQLKMVSVAILPPIKEEAEGLKALGVPDTDQGKGSAIVDGLGEVVQELEENPQRMQRQPDPFASVAAEAKDYGFTTCILYY